MTNNSFTGIRTEEDTTNPILDDYLTDIQLADELNVSPRTIARWRGMREGPPVTRLGRRVMYRRSSVKKWLSDCENGLVAS